MTGITPTAGHIHTQAVPTNATRSGGVTFGFTSLVSPIAYTSVALTAAQEADLLGGIMYLNFHTPANPGGEIRGNLTAR